MQTLDFLIKLMYFFFLFLVNLAFFLGLKGDKEDDNDF